MADGTWLRYGEVEHHCHLPESAMKGAVWRCDCGRRYTATATSHSFSGPHWRLRFWPWPRRAARPPTTEETP